MEKRIITKNEFKKRMLQLIRSYTKLGLRYANLVINCKNPKLSNWYQKKIEELAEDIKFNLQMVRQADIEEGYLIYYIDADGNLTMSRCSREEYLSVYKKKNRKNYIT